MAAELASPAPSSDRGAHQYGVRHLDTIEDQRARFGASVFTQVINLDRSPDRLATIKSYLEAAHIPFQRFSGIEGRALDLDNDAKLKPMLDLKAWVRGHHRNPTRADIGCYLSHYYALEAFLAQDKPLGLILEDDAAFAPDLIEKIIPAIDGAAAWDILRLHARHPGPLTPRVWYNNGTSLRSFVGRPAGTTAYMVNRKAAARMLKHLIPARRMIDWTFDQSHLMNLRLRALTPMPVSLQKVQSTRDGIKPNRSWLEKQTDRPLAPRWSLPFTRTWDEVQRLVYTLFIDGGLVALIAPPAKPR
jgi:glycosyl transferase family 25